MLSWEGDVMKHMLSQSLLCLVHGLQVNGTAIGIKGLTYLKEEVLSQDV